MNGDLYLDICNFLYHEANLLDSRKYKEWLELLSDDVVYKMPVRNTVEKKDNPFDRQGFHMHETKKSLETRVNRLYTNSAWVEDPPPRQRHYISNIAVEPGERDNEYKVRSYFLFRRSRGSEQNAEELSGVRHDVLVKENGGWRIRERTIYTDHAVIPTMNLAMFL